jgi:hypothetical protein
MGGAWQCAALPPRTGEVNTGVSKTSVIAKTTAEQDIPGTNVDWTKGACDMGMFLQQSWAL